MPRRLTGRVIRELKLRAVNLTTGAGQAQPPQEKGIDVALAVDLMHLALRGRHNALVLFSSDTDLLPALESIVDLRLRHVEVACWSGFKPLRFPASNSPLPYCHFLSQADWNATVDDWKGRV